MAVSLITVLLCSTLTLQAALKDNSASCDCYITSSSDYFQYHRFFDFRSVTSGKNSYDVEPANITSVQSKGDEIGQQGYLNSNAFSNDWKIKNWGRDVALSRPVKLQNSKQNVYIKTENASTSATNLVLRTYRNTDFSSCGEIEATQRNIFHASIRIHARVHGDSGAVAGMFMYYNDSQESDIEILTRDNASTIHYTNQPNTDADGRTIRAAETQIMLPNSRAWSDWSVHRLDWVKGLSQWFVNGDQVASTTYGVPTVPSYMVLNMWSNGGNWSGNMTIGSAAYLEVQWIDMFFNTSGPNTVPTKRKRAQASECMIVCAADGIKQVGFPERLLRSEGISVSHALSYVFACSVLILIAVDFLW